MLVILFIPCFLFLFLSFISCYEHFHYFLLFSFNCFWFDDYIMSSILLYQYMCHYSVCYTFNPVNFVSEQDRWKLLCSICGVSYGACIQVSLEFSIKEQFMQFFLGQQADLQSLQLVYQISPNLSRCYQWRLALRILTDHD